MVSSNFNQFRGRSHERAEAAFKKEPRQGDGRNVMAASEIEVNATRQKTARLRALRLARDAAVMRAAAGKKRQA